jgi:hypothetical protein
MRFWRRRLSSGSVTSVQSSSLVFEADNARFLEDGLEDVDDISDESRSVSDPDSDVSAGCFFFWAGGDEGVECDTFSRVIGAS